MFRDQILSESLTEISKTKIIAIDPVWNEEDQIALIFQVYIVTKNSNGDLNDSVPAYRDSTQF